MPLLEEFVESIIDEKVEYFNKKPAFPEDPKGEDTVKTLRAESRMRHKQNLAYLSEFDASVKAGHRKPLGYVYTN